MTDDPITAAESEMLDYANAVTAEAVGFLRMIAEAQRTGRPAWRWATIQADPFDTIEAARAIQAFPPSARPLDRPDDV